MISSAGSSHVITRALRADDKSAWAEMWSDYLAFYETSLPQSVYVSTFERLVDEGDTAMFGLIAETASGPAGIANCIVHAHGWKAAPVVYLQDLFTRPAARGQGVGEALIENVYRTADTLAAAGTYWLTQEFNHTARKLYDRVGELTPFIKYQRV